MKYLLSGWIGHGNLGDDLLLFSTVSELQANDINAQIVVLSYRQQTTKHFFEKWGIHNVKVVQRLFGRIKWRWQLLRLAKWSDFYVVAGGTAIRDFSMAPNSVVHQYKMARIAHFAGSKVEFIGLGAGPIWRNRSKKIISKLFRFAHGSIRDSSSYDLLVQHGATNVTQTADLVFSLSPVKGLKHKKIKCVAIVLRMWENSFNNDERSFSPEWNTFLQTVHDFYPDANVSLFCMQANFNSPHDDDIRLAQSISKSTSNQVHINKLSNCSLDELKHHFTSVDLVISMRLHGLVLAAMAGCRLIGIEYDPKISGLLQDLSLQDYSIHYGDGMVDDLIRLLGKVEDQTYSTQGQHQKALMNFDFLAKGR